MPTTTNAALAAMQTEVASPAISGGLESRPPVPATLHATVAVVGLGYVGLPTSLALFSAGFWVLGVDVSERRLNDIREEAAELLGRDRSRLGQALGHHRFALGPDAGVLRDADAVVVCVPTPTDEQNRPDLRCLRSACADVVEHARRDQLIVLTSTTYVGTTRELLIEPLERRGLRVGEDVFVAFSPERIDPGNERHAQEDVARVVGAASDRCASHAVSLLAGISSRLHVVSSPEAAELTKLYENTFRAVNIAFANEMAGVATRFGLDAMEVTEAAATKPYGFMPFYPGPGVGGHCIPCDPHYLLQGLHELQAEAPIVQRSMDAIAARPRQVAERAASIVSEVKDPGQRGRVLLVGASYKPGIRDVRESPALEILAALQESGAEVSYHDPLVRALELSPDLALLSVAKPVPADYDLVLVLTIHPGHDYSWLADCEHVLDCTYRTPAGRRRHLL